MDAATSAPIFGDTSMVTGGVSKLSAELITPAMMVAIGTANETPPRNEIIANTACFHIWCGSDVNT